MTNLKKYLQYNAGFSTLSGLIMLVASGYLQNLFDFNNSLVFPVIGISLVFFGALVYYVSQKQLENKSLVQLITVLDVLWVLGSLVIIVFQLFSLSSQGYLITGLIMILIAYFAYNQFRNN